MTARRAPWCLALLAVGFRVAPTQAPVTAPRQSAVACTLSVHYDSVYYSDNVLKAGESGTVAVGATFVSVHLRESNAFNANADGTVDTLGPDNRTTTLTFSSLHGDDAVEITLTTSNDAGIYQSTLLASPLGDGLSHPAEIGNVSMRFRLQGDRLWVRVVGPREGQKVHACTRPRSGVRKDH